MGTGCSKPVSPVFYTAPCNTAVVGVISRRRICYPSTRRVNNFTFPIYFLDTNDRSALVEGTWKFSIFSLIIFNSYLFQHPLFREIVIHQRFWLDQTTYVGVSSTWSSLRQSTSWRPRRITRTFRKTAHWCSAFSRIGNCKATKGVVKENDGKIVQLKKNNTKLALKNNILITQADATERARARPNQARS